MRTRRELGAISFLEPHGSVLRSFETLGADNPRALLQVAELFPTNLSSFRCFVLLVLDVEIFLVDVLQRVLAELVVPLLTNLVKTVHVNTLQALEVSRSLRLQHRILTHTQRYRVGRELIFRTLPHAHSIGLYARRAQPVHRLRHGACVALSVTFVEVVWHVGFCRLARVHLAL